MSIDWHFMFQLWRAIATTACIASGLGCFIGAFVEMDPSVGGMFRTWVILRRVGYGMAFALLTSLLICLRF